MFFVCGPRWCDMTGPVVLLVPIRTGRARLSRRIGFVPFLCKQQHWQQNLFNLYVCFGVGPLLSVQGCLHHDNDGHANLGPRMPAIGHFPWKWARKGASWWPFRFPIRCSFFMHFNLYLYYDDDMIWYGGPSITDVPMNCCSVDQTKEEKIEQIIDLPAFLCNHLRKTVDEVDDCCH